MVEKKYIIVANVESWNPETGRYETNEGGGVKPRDLLTPDGISFGTLKIGYSGVQGYLGKKQIVFETEMTGEEYDNRGVARPVVRGFFPDWEALERRMGITLVDRGTGEAEFPERFWGKNWSLFDETQQREYREARDHFSITLDDGSHPEKIEVYAGNLGDHPERLVINITVPGVGEGTGELN